MFIMYVYILTCTIVQDTWIKGQENMARIVIYRVELWTASNEYQKENFNIKNNYLLIKNRVIESLLQIW